MPGIYSTLFCYSSDLSVGVYYTVPDGQTAVVKDVDVYNGGGQDGALFMGFSDGDQDYEVWAYDFSSGPAVASWRGGLVVPSGMVLGMICSTGGASGAMSGFLLASG